MKQFFKKNLRFLYDYLADIKYYFMFHKFILRLKELGNILKDDSDKNNKTVVFNLIRTYIFVQLFIEIIFALKLKARGYHVVILYDDGVLLHHETLTKGENKFFSPYYKNRMKYTIKMLQKISYINGMLVPYSTLFKNIAFNQKDIENLKQNNYKYDGIDFFEYIEASLVRYYLSAPDMKILRQEDDYEEVLDTFIVNSLISYTIAKNSIEKFNPDLMITSHGIYTTWGTFMKKYLVDSIRVVTYGGNGYVTNGIDFGINDIAANKIDNGFFKYFVSNIEESEKVEYLNKTDELMQSRFSGKSSDTSKIQKYVGDGEEEIIQTIIKLKKSKKIYALFPNVMWDNATTFKNWNTVFNSPVEWLVQTVQYFLNEDNKVLIIRAHPAEYIWMNVNIGIKDILEFYFGKEIFCNDKIIFIPPEQKIMSYNLFPLLDAGIVYNGTIGLELMYKGVPLITGARTAYSNKGFTNDITSSNKYFEVFDSLESIDEIQKDNKDLLKLFIYEYFFLHGVPLKILSNINLLEPNYEDDIKDIWNDKNLEYVISTMEGTNNNYFQNWNKYEKLNP